MLNQAWEVMVRINSKALLLWMSVVLASLGSSAASSPIYLAQVTCLDTMSCCVLKSPPTAAQRCGATASDIAKALDGAKLLHDATPTAGVMLKEEAHAQEGAQADAASEASDEPPNCKGQNHHIISRPISEQLEKHETLRGLYKPRDERFVTRAKDKESHCGYQQWHRDVDKEVIKWLQDRKTATPKQFEQFLRALYNRKDLLERFPNGF
jgi:hypothetical protein